MLTPETLDSLIAEIKIREVDPSSPYSSVEFLKKGNWPAELRQLQVLTIHCADYVSHRIAEKKFDSRFIKKALISPPRIDLGLLESLAPFEDWILKIISTGISSSLIEEKNKQIKSRLIQFLIDKEFRKYEQTLGLHGSLDVISRGNNILPDLRNLLHNYDYGIAIARGALFTGFYAGLFDFPTGVIHLSHHDRGNGFCQKISLMPEKIKGKKILVFEDDVQSGATLEHFCREIAAYEPASLDLLLSVPSLGKPEMEKNVLKYYPRYILKGRAGEALPQEISSRLISIKTPSDLKQMEEYLSSQMPLWRGEYEAGKITKQEFLEYLDMSFFLRAEKDKLVIFLKTLTTQKKLLTKADKIPGQFNRVFYVDDFPESPAVVDYLFERYNSKYSLVIGKEK